MHLFTLHFLLFIVLLVTTSNSVDLDQLQIFLLEGDDKRLLYSNNKKDSFFDFYGENGFSCKVPPVLIEKNTVPTREIFVKNNNDPSKPTNTINVSSVDIESSYPIISPSVTGGVNMSLGAGSQLSFSIDYNCDYSKVDKNDFWGILFLTIHIENGESLTFSYKKVCSDDLVDYNFDYSFIIVAVFCILMVAWQSKKPKILSSLKDFAGCSINITFTICYIVIASILLITLIYSQTVMILIYTIIMAILCCLAFGLFFNELLTGNLLRHNISKILIQIPKLGKISLLLLLGFFLSIPLVVFWAISYDWIASDALTLIITAVCLKLLKFKNLRTATYFFCVEILFELIWGVIFIFGLERSYDQFFSSDFTLPLKIECLAFGEFLNKKCVWISITNMVFPGLLLSYFYRYDASKNFNVYFFFSLIAFILGNVFWIIVQSRVEFATPASIYSFSLMLIFTLILAHKRNENIELWNGTFFDVELSDPLINSKNLMENQGKNENNDNLNLTINSEKNEENSDLSYMEGTQNLEDGSRIRFGNQNTEERFRDK